MLRLPLLGVLVAAMLAGFALPAIAHDEDAGDLGVRVTRSTSTVQSGHDVTFTVTVRNVGDDSASHIVVDTAVPAGTTFVGLEENGFDCTTPSVGATGAIRCTLDSLDEDHSRWFRFTVHVPSSAVEGATISATATVSSDSVDTNPANDTDTSTVTVHNPGPTTADLRAAVTASRSSLSVGDDVRFAIRVSNLGGTSAHDVVVHTTVPSGSRFVSIDEGAFECSSPPAGGTGEIDCTLSSLSSGESRAFSFRVHVPNVVPVPSTLTDTATVSSSTPDPNPANNTASATVTVTSVTPEPDPLQITGLSASPTTLWPPNGRMVEVTVNYTVTGGVDPTCSLDVTSSQGSASDWQIVDDHHVRLRASRTGFGGERIYTIRVTCVDEATGQTVTRSTQVVVPHDVGHRENPIQLIGGSIGLPSIPSGHPMTTMSSSGLAIVR